MKKLIYVTGALLIMGTTLFQSQIVLNTPVAQQNQEVSDPNSITLAPGFSASSSIINTFRAYIGDTNNNNPVIHPDYSGSGTIMENYIATRTYLEATNTSSSSAKQFYDIQYFDGLGRPKQVVNVKASPQGKDIVTYFEYD